MVFLPGWNRLHRDKYIIIYRYFLSVCKSCTLTPICTETQCAGIVCVQALHSDFFDDTLFKISQCAR